MPVVPLSQLKADKENVRPARGQRASLEADQAVADRVQVALEELKSLGDSGDGVKYAEFFGEQLRKMSAEIGALKKDRDADRSKLAKYSEAAKSQETSARADTAKEKLQKAMERRMKQLENMCKSAPLTYERFIDPENPLSKIMGSLIFLDTIPVLKAHINLLNSYYPLDFLRWVDTNEKTEGEPDDAEAVEDGEEGEPEEEEAPPKKQRRRCPMKKPEDAVVLWLFLLRTGASYNQAGAMFGVSRTTVRRVLNTMTLLHEEFFREEFFVLAENSLRSIIPNMMKTFREHEGVDTCVTHIIDGFERRMEKPQDDEAAAACWSQYKHMYTAKFLLGILSSGARV